MLLSSNSNFYKDFLYKKLKPKSDGNLFYCSFIYLNKSYVNLRKKKTTTIIQVLECLLEMNEQKLQKANELSSIYNVALASQDDVWICGRIFSENASGGGKLTEHGCMLQGSYVCSNSQSISLAMNGSNTLEYSLFPGQMVIVNGRNPDGKRFICKQIVEPSFPPATNNLNIEHTIQIKLNESNSPLTILAASGPYMTHGSLQATNLNLLVDMAKAKNVHALVLVILSFLISNNE